MCIIKLTFFKGTLTLYKTTQRQNIIFILCNIVSKKGKKKTFDKNNVGGILNIL